jgi:UDP-N-acetylglucosamine--N-acetylmuramyl-(pentapeptide) pyrophosphoryl-undecaprenol N-acetylglucosamine transferase
VHHVIGRRDWPALERPDDTGELEYVAVEYEDDMPGQLARADLVVCRGGSGTLFELAATGRPAIVVPSLVTTGGQQIANAERLAATGGAVVVRDDELDGDRLAAEVDALLGDPDRLRAMGQHAAALAAPDAAERVADLVEEHARAR